MLKSSVVTANDRKQRMHWGLPQVSPH